MNNKCDLLVSTSPVIGLFLTSGYVFNPINDDLMIIRSFPENVKSVLWDNSVTDKEIFVVLDNNNNMHTFIINPDDVEEGGASVSCLGQTKVPQVKSYFDLILYPSLSVKFQIMDRKITENLEFKSPLQKDIFYFTTF